jgi:hypothetical protein
LGIAVYLVQKHFATNNLAKHVFPALGADGDEVRAGMGVVITWEADGMAPRWLHGGSSFAQEGV